MSCHLLCFRPLPTALQTRRRLPSSHTPSLHHFFRSHRFKSTVPGPSFHRRSFRGIHNSNPIRPNYVSNSHNDRKRWSSGKAPPSNPEPPHASRASTALTSFAIGGLAGTCGSLAGMGGGFLMVPLLTSWVGLSQHRANATSLFAVATTGLAGALGWSRKQGSDEHESVVDAGVAAAVALSGMATAALGAHASSRLSPRRLKQSLGVFLLLVAPTVPLQQHWKQPTTASAPPEEAAAASPGLPRSTTTFEFYHDETSPEAFPFDEEHHQRYWKAVLVGCGSGFLAGVFGVGGGAVTVPALTLGLDMNHYQALGTSLCAMVPTAVVGTLTHLSKGTVALRVAPPLALGAFVGAFCGGSLGGLVPEETLQTGFGATLVVLGLRTLLKA